ncbi:hypothetical protein DAI22_01g333800 [Oryza sativa Japonica Group]|nr:hypothetical protein DAI22_01g333800 [Oryza sativa Japonica Group]
MTGGYITRAWSHPSWRITNPPALSRETNSTCDRTDHINDADAARRPDLRPTHVTPPTGCAAPPKAPAPVTPRVSRGGLGERRVTRPPHREGRKHSATPPPRRIERRAAQQPNVYEFEPQDVARPRSAGVEKERERRGGGGEKLQQEGKSTNPQLGDSSSLKSAIPYPSAANTRAWGARGESSLASPGRAGTPCPRSGDGGRDLAARLGGCGELGVGVGWSGVSIGVAGREGGRRGGVLIW